MNRTFYNSSRRLLSDPASVVRCKHRSISQRFRRVILAGLMLTIAGCGATEQASDSQEGEHLEHFVPAHKPKDFSSLVDQLALRFPQLGSEGSSTDANNPGGNARQELADIIGWIPELAADSDLKKAEFESAVVAADKLSKLFKDPEDAATAKPFEAAAVEPLIEELRQLVAKSQAEQK